MVLAKPRDFLLMECLLRYRDEIRDAGICFTLGGLAGFVEQDGDERSTLLTQRLRSYGVQWYDIRNGEHVVDSLFLL